MTWLLITAVLAAGAVFAVLGANDTRWDRRSLPPVRQRPPRVPYLPDTRTGPWHPEFHLTRGRRVRKARARTRYWQEP